MKRARVVAALGGVAALLGLWATYVPVPAQMSHLNELGNVLFGLFAVLLGAGTVYRVAFGFGLDTRHALANLVVGGALLAMVVVIQATFLTRMLDLITGATLVGATVVDLFRDSGVDIGVNLPSG